MDATAAARSSLPCSHFDGTGRSVHSLEIVLMEVTRMVMGDGEPPDAIASELVLMLANLVPVICTLWPR